MPAWLVKVLHTVGLTNLIRQDVDRYAVKIAPPEVIAARLDDLTAAGPIDAFVLAKIREAIMTATEPLRLAEAISQLLPGLFPATAADLASHSSDKLRAILLPLVR
jgi:hypothetical protein